MGLLAQYFIIFVNDNDFELCNEMFGFIYLAGLSWIVQLKKMTITIDLFSGVKIKTMEM
jgi:hypothetical protein